MNHLVKKNVVVSIIFFKILKNPEFGGKIFSRRVDLGLGLSMLVKGPPPNDFP